MPASKQVGTSYRTPAKHAAMNALMGREAGAFPYVATRLRAQGMVFVDATAGDAADENSSPRLCLRHMETVRESGLRVETHLIDWDDGAASALQLDIGWESPPNVYIHNQDAREVMPMIAVDDMALTVIDDPNDSGASTLTSPVVNWAFTARATTIFASIGANANGRARQSGHYEESFARYNNLLDIAEGSWPFRRQVVFARLLRDAHRWGYLIICSERFAKDVQREFQRIYAGTAQVVSGFAETREGLRRLHSMLPEREVLL